MTNQPQIADMAKEALANVNAHIDMKRAYHRLMVRLSFDEAFKDADWRTSRAIYEHMHTQGRVWPVRRFFGPR